MDALWFKNALKDRQLSQRRLATHLGIDHSAVSNLFAGKRRMTTHEAHQLSVILGYPVTEVLRRAGMDVRDDVRSVPIAAYMDANGTITQLPAETHDTVTSPADCPIGTYAVQIRAHTSSKDGWLVFVSPTRVDAQESLDQLCACATTTGKLMLGTVRRGYRRDTQNLILWPSDETISDAALAWTSPVLWIKPT